jgi:hypothetical protein
MHFSLKQTAHAANTEPSFVRSLISRGLIPLKADKGDIDSTGTGDHRQFSINRVMQIAIAVALIRMTLSHKRAADAALVFSDVGSSGGRLPSQLCHGGKTALLVFEDGARVLKVDNSTNLLAVLLDGATEQREMATVLLVDPIHKLVLERLGLAEESVAG